MQELIVIIVEDLETLFWFSKFLWARERISAKFVENLGTRPRKGSPALISEEGERKYGYGSSRKWMLECSDWTDLAQDRDKWRALPNTVKKKKCI
jgi:hypothetical protein